MADYVTNFDIYDGSVNKNVLIKDKETSKKLNDFIDSDVYMTYTNPIVKHNKRYYVDCVNGNDNNDGSSEEKAFKTLEHFFDITIKSGLPEARCYLVSAGTYSAEIFTCTNIALHIEGKTEGIILNLHNTANYPIAFYDCHINLKNITLTSPGIYFDSGSFLGASCILRGEIATYGGYISLNRSTFDFIDAEGAFLSFYTVTIDTSGTNSDLITANNCMIYFTGLVSQTGSNKTGSFGNFVACNFYLLSAFTSCEGKFTKGVALNACNFYGTGARAYTLFKTSNSLPEITECRFNKLQNYEAMDLYSGEAFLLPTKIVGTFFEVYFDFGGYRRCQKFEVVDSNRYEISATHIDSNGARSYISVCTFELNEKNNGLYINILSNATITFNNSQYTYNNTPDSSAKYINIVYVAFMNF